MLINAVFGRLTIVRRVSFVFLVDVSCVLISDNRYFQKYRSMDATQQQQYEFSRDEAVQKWRTLTANEGVLLENEFTVRFAILFGRFDLKKSRISITIRNFDNMIQLVRQSQPIREINRKIVTDQFIHVYHLKKYLFVLIDLELC